VAKDVGVEMKYTHFVFVCRSTFDVNVYGCTFDMYVEYIMCINIYI